MEGIVGIYKSSAPTLGPNDQYQLQLDEEGRLLVSSGAGLPGAPDGGVQSVQEVGALLAAVQSTDPVQVYSSNSYVNLTNSSAAIKSGAGTFFGLTVGAPGTTISVTVYDSLTAAGTILYGPVVLPAAGTTINMPGGGLAFGVGLSIGFSATTGTPNITAAFR